jgi:phosphonoacetaldehyde hydrolase
LNEYSITAVVFDWAGTTVDYGCCAPAQVFQQVFEQSGIPITPAQAREPMGAAKRDHIAKILAMPDVAGRWEEKHGAAPGDDDVEQLYQKFLPLQLSVLSQHTDLIPGTVETFQWLREHGIQVGSTTGYTRALMEVVTPSAWRQGYRPDAVVCSDDVRVGRPAPWMCMEALHRLNAFPAWTCVKVDDTPVGILAGKHAGAWTVAVVKTGNQLGLSATEVAALDEEELEDRLEPIRSEFVELGADYVVDSVAELPAVIEKIGHRSDSGQMPLI